MRDRDVRGRDKYPPMKRPPSAVMTEVAGPEPQADRFDRAGVGARLDEERRRAEDGLDLRPLNRPLTLMTSRNITAGP